MLDVDDVEAIMLDVDDAGTMMLDVGAMLNCVKKSLTAVKQS